MLAINRTDNPRAHSLTRPDPRASANPPKVPTFILPTPANAVSFGDVLGVARQISRLRRKRPIRLHYAPHTRLGATFPAFDVFAVEADDSEVWLGAAAIQTRDLQVLRTALFKQLGECVGADVDKHAAWRLQLAPGFQGCHHTGVFQLITQAFLGCCL